MKKLLQLKTMLLLCALIVGSGNVWAADGVATLPFNWEGGTSSAFTALDGVSANGLGSDYSGTHSPYYIKLDGTGDYIVIHTNSQPNVVSIGVKMIGGNSTSSITVQGSSDGENYSDIEALSISGSQNTILTLTTTKSFDPSDRYVKLLFTKGSNVGIGPISITKMPSTLSSIAVSGTPDDFNLGDTWKTTGITVTATYTDASTDDVTAKASYTGYDKSQAGDQTISVSYTENEVTKNTSYDIYVNDFTGLSLSGTYKTEFWTNDEFSHDGVVVKAKFENNNEKVVDDAEFSTPVMSSAGIKPVTVSYTIEGVQRSTTYDITVSDKPKYTITWMVNGVKNKSAKITMDESLSSEFPSVSAINGKDFMGWVTTATVASDYSGGYVNTSAETATGNKTYYAVFAAKGSANVTDNLIRETTGVNNNAGYSNWSNKTVTSGAVYAGNSAGGNDAIQLRTDNSNSGVITTASGGKAKKVVVAWGNATIEGRTLDVYGKNTAYSTAADLYDANKKGTLLGSIVNGTSTELNITGDYEYIGVRSSDKAMWLNTLSITWYGEVYSNYTTTPSAVGASVTIGSAGYATFVHPYAVEIPDGVEAFVVTETPTSSAKLTSVPTNIPANTPVVLKAAADDYDFDLAEGDVDAIDGNYLKVSDESTSNGVYVLANKTHGVGFYLWEGGLLGAGRVYLDVPTSAREFISFDFNDETGIEKIDNAISNKENGVVFNLAGQRVAQPSKGLYIVNGRKVIVK